MVLLLSSCLALSCLVLSCHAASYPFPCQHIIWHLAAGYGGYLQALTLVVARAGELEIAVELSWAWGVVPIIIRSPHPQEAEEHTKKVK